MKLSLLIITILFVLVVGIYISIVSQTSGQTKALVKKSESVIISDSEYNLNNWTVQIRLDSNGATHSYNQQLSGGNPGSYLQMIYNMPLPPSPQISAIMVLYKYTGDYYVPSVQGKIDSITYREDLRHEQPNGFVLSFPVVYQSGKIYRANNFSLMFTEPGIWHTGIRTGLVQNNFFNIDGSGTRPNFSVTGDTIYFGFERSRSRGYTQTDTSYNTFIQGSDNFRVTINPQPANLPPVANDDVKVYDTGNSINKFVLPKINDYDPDGDVIFIDSLYNNNGFANIYLSNDTVYFYNELLGHGIFNYRLNDGELFDYARVDVLVDCICIFQCLSGLNRESEFGERYQVQDSVDLNLIRRFRDEVMKPSFHGSRYVEMYYETTPEILFLIAILQPTLIPQAVTMVELLQPAIRNLLDGDGQQPITAEQINAIQNFLTNLSAAGNSNIQQIVAEELKRLGPLENYIGMPISKVIFQTMVTEVKDEQQIVPTQFVLEQNYPNPFNPSTVIGYRLPVSGDVTLKVYDLLGKEVATLVNEEKPAGTYEVIFDASWLSSGVYYYKITAGNYSETKKMVLLR